jgi:hypothetical protein
MSDKLPLDARHLSLRDLKRAKAGPLQGRDPYELMPDSLERQTLIAWCMRSRDDPEFTWADAEDATTVGDFEWGDQDQDQDGDEPPLTGSSDGPGEPDATPTPKSSRAKPPAPEPSTSSDPSSASPETSSSS